MAKANIKKHNINKSKLLIKILTNIIKQIYNMFVKFIFERRKNMAKIVQISESVISIGLDDGSIQEVRASDINFVPHVGDEVEVFKSETKVIVSKVQPAQTNIPNGGININLQNVQTSIGEKSSSNTKAVNKVAYCLLAFFLGGIGIHKFYAGKTGAGILYLIFCWSGIPAIISFIEFIVALCKKADANGNILV